MPRFGFTSGGTYQSRSLSADAQRCVNWIPEIIESQLGKSKIAYYDRMGSKTFANLAGETSVPQMLYQNGRRFAVGVNLWELFPNATTVNRGGLTALNGPVSIAASNIQLLICSGGKLWVYTLATNTLVPVNMAQFNGAISLVAYSDGFFMALQQSAQVFYLSNLLDGTTWSALNASQILYFPDNIKTMIVDHRELWLAGDKQSVGYYNSGAGNSPFVPIPGAFIETGALCVQAITKLDNTPFWLGADERGALVAYRASGYTPQRVSTHAIENAWSAYPVASDAISYAMQDRGHVLWVIYFPSAANGKGATWVYDVSTQLWHEWTYLDPILGEIAHRSMCHMYCPDNNTHLVGDWKSGKVFLLAPTYYDDDGVPMKRTRIAPYVGDEERTVHSRLRLVMETGVGPIPPLAGTAAPTSIILQAPNLSLWALRVSDAGILSQTAVAAGTPETVILNDLGGANSWQLGVSNAGVLTQTAVAFSAAYPNGRLMVTASGTLIWRLQLLAGGIPQQMALGNVPRDPQVFMDWSDDGAKTWSNSQARSIGAAGEYRKRVTWNRLGSPLNWRAYRVTCSDPVPARIIDAFLKAGSA
jgi:hypothetical protein